MSESPTASLFIIESRIQRQRLKDMQAAAQKRRITISTTFCSEVTHVVTEFTDYDAVLRKLGVEDMSILEGVEVVSTKWFAESMKAGRVVPVEARHRLQRQTATNPQLDRPSEAENAVIPDFSCQRATPLEHHNEKYTQALEVLEKFADLRDEDQDYSRALAFRRAACVLKSLPGPVTSIQQLRHVTNFGDHSRRVVQAILEDGECDEVENILRDPWFHHMKLFTGVFGIGPSTAKQLISRGWTTIREVQQGFKSGDWRVQWGLAFYEDLSTSVMRVEADHIASVIEKHLRTVLSGAIMCVTGGFRRGKSSGHDVDILITHPQETKINGALPRLLQSLETTDMVLCGRLERSTYTDDVLSTNTKLSTRGQLDHFEKWIGMLKVPKQVRDSNKSKKADCDLFAGFACNTEGCKTAQEGEVASEGNVQSEVINCTNCATEANRHVDVSLNENLKNGSSSFEEDSFDISQLKASHTKGDKHGNRNTTAVELAEEERDWLARRVDLIISPYSQYYYALVGWTGSKQFNRDARLYAERRMNMKLSSHGLYDIAQRRSIPAESEKEVFDNLKLPYFPPTQRNC